MIFRGRVINPYHCSEEHKASGTLQSDTHQTTAEKQPRWRRTPFGGATGHDGAGSYVQR